MGADAAVPRLALLLAQTKHRVIASEQNRERHEEALRLQRQRQETDLDVARCEMVHGDIRERLELLESVDTLIARSVDLLFARHHQAGVCRRLPSRRKRRVARQQGSRATITSRTGAGRSARAFNYFATLERMTSLLSDCGYRIARSVAEGDPIAVGARKAAD